MSFRESCLLGCVVIGKTPGVLENVGVLDLAACKSASENDEMCVAIEHHLNNTCVLWYTKWTMQLLPVNASWTV